MSEMRACGARILKGRPNSVSCAITINFQTETPPLFQQNKHQKGLRKGTFSTLESGVRQEKQSPPLCVGESLCFSL